MSIKSNKYFEQCKSDHKPPLANLTGNHWVTESEMGQLLTENTVKSSAWYVLQIIILTKT